MARRSAEAPVTFFSFQDVLLSLIGITILVTVLLIISSMVQAVETVERAVSAAQSDPASAATVTALKERRDQLTEALRRAQRRPNEDPTARRATLRQEVLAAREELDDLKREVEQLERSLRDILLRHPEAGAARRFQSLEERRQELESELEREQRRRQVTYLLGDSPKGMPVGVEVSSRGFLVFSVEKGGGSLMVSADGSLAAITEAASVIAGGKPFYLLFVVKPSGIDHYRGIVAERNAMPEDRRPGMGLDLVAESSILDGAMPGRQESGP
jgi:Flp pilus assembly protein TadB